MWESFMQVMRAEVPDWAVLGIVGLFAGIIFGMVASR